MHLSPVCWKIQVRVDPVSLALACNVRLYADVPCILVLKLQQDMLRLYERLHELENGREEALPGASDSGAPFLYVYKINTPMLGFSSDRRSGPKRFSIVCSFTT